MHKVFVSNTRCLRTSAVNDYGTFAACHPSEEREKRSVLGDTAKGAVGGAVAGAVLPGVSAKTGATVGAAAGAGHAVGKDHAHSHDQKHV